MKLTDVLIPLIIAGILLYGVLKGVDVFAVFIEGAKQGLRTAIRILPALIAFMTAVGMFKASGALDVLTYATGPIAEALGFPQECLPLALLRPISGSGSLALFEGVLQDNGADSFPGRVASVILGSSETTFYTIAVYYSVTSVKQTRHTTVSALMADFTGMVMSAVAVRLMMG